jgi:DNA-binding transcriptional LysR family regulator
MDAFKNLHLFVEVAKANSFRRAADVLGIPNPTVSRRIRELERSLGVRLFNRTTRRVELTEGGRLYFENCRRILEEAQLTLLELSNLQTQPSGVIRASIPVDFSVIYLGPLLTDFARLYPKIRFELDLTPAQSDLVGDPVDIAIRMGPPKDQNLIARPIASLGLRLFASPEYVGQRGIPQHPQDLLKHECLRMRDAPWTLHHSDGHSQTIEVHGQFTANNVGLLMQLARGGNGIVMTPENWATTDIVQKKLVRVLPDWSPPPVQVYALSTTRMLPAKVRVLIDYLAEKMAVPQSSRS